MRTLFSAAAGATRSRKYVIRSHIWSSEAGPVSEDQMWERITYFLDRVAPAAAENKVRIACHPHDPGMPRDRGFRGVHRVLGSVDGLKRFVSIRENPYQ